MYKVYWKQALSMLKENKLLSVISILGTALAIAMIMVIVIVWQVRTADYPPENNRNRMLFVKAAGATRIADNTENSSGMLSLNAIKEVFYPLKSAESVGISSYMQQKFVSVTDETVRFPNDVLYTDANFWKIFNFRFIAGQPYMEEEVNSGIHKAVICETTARRLFGSADVVGNTVLLGYVPYTISGVVEDVSLLAESAYANVWLPYSTHEPLLRSYCEDLLGAFSCYILVSEPSNLSSVKAETESNVNKLNSGLSDWWLKLDGAPDTQMDLLARTNSAEEPDTKMLLAKYILILGILLLIPAINMSGISLSRMQKRMAEIGVRKSFGATRTKLLEQILYENMFLTLLGGITGLVVSYIALFILQDWLLASNVSVFATGSTIIKAGMIFSPLIFGLAFLFCLLMNLLSAGIPAWRASSMNIIDALNEKQ